MKDFNIDLVESVMEAVLKDTRQKKKFNLIRQGTRKNNARKNWNIMVRATKSHHNPIGKSNTERAESLDDLREQVSIMAEIIIRPIFDYILLQNFHYNELLKILKTNTNVNCKKPTMKVISPKNP